MRNFFIFLSLFLSSTLLAQNSSVLAEGRWVKMSLQKAGIYRIDHNTLHKMGFEPGEINPENFAIYGHRGGMLPQANDEQYPTDLVELSIQVLGEEDGVFNEGDQILFYADEVDAVDYLSDENRFQVKKNLYTSTMHFFLTVKQEKGKRLKRALNLGLNHPLTDYYSEVIHHEEEMRNLLKSGRKWFGELLPNQFSFQITQDIQDIKSNGNFRLEINAMSQAFVNTELDITLNNQTIGSLSFNPIPNQQYGLKGDEQSLFFKDNNELFNNSEFELSLTFDAGGSNNARAFLDYFTLDIEREARFTEGQQLMRLPIQTQTAVSTFRIQTNTNDIQLWNVTDPLSVEYQDFESFQNHIEFGYFADLYQEYVVFQTNQLPFPSSFELITNQNLHGTSPVDFVIISHPDFEQEAQRLANFRRQNDDLSVLVVTPESIYNEFSGGRQDITALRNFIRHKYQQGSLKYVLLFGKGSYDYKNILGTTANFVPTYESRNSLHPLLTFSSDDYFGFLDEDEGYWEESRLGDHILDIGIGRIPATTIAQAETMVDKIIHYQTQSSTFGEWRSRFVFVADDGDFNIHQRDADQLASTIEQSTSSFQAKKIYLDQYPQEISSNRERSEAATKALKDAVNNGTLVVNFTGHGSEFVWMQERVLTLNSIEEWRNPNALPFVITATCEFGRNDDTQIFSGAEKLMFMENGGAIGLLTTARPVFSSSNFALNKALYDIILNNSDGYPRLGDIVKFTKNNALRGSLNRNFILLGDPSMQLAYPQAEIEITTINEKPFSLKDTLKAMQPISLTGQVVSGNERLQNFNGTVLVQLKDKAQTKVTLGSDNPPFEYQERDQVLFKGLTTVENGQFELSFTIPKNIDDTFGDGEMMAYAVDTVNHQDALGGSKSFTLGGVFENPLSDKTPPNIKVFLNDTLRAIQGTYAKSVLSIIQLTDNMGINISQAIPGHDIELTLNDSITEIVTHLWEPLSSDGTRGQLIFPWNQLPAGTNKLMVKAWDIFGNAQTEEVNFIVSDQAPIIKTIKNYPNPFISETTFEVKHALIGNDLDVQINIIDTQANPVTTLKKTFYHAGPTLSLTWDRSNPSGQAVSAGIYLFQIQLSSKTNGISDVKRSKMIISN